MAIQLTFSKRYELLFASIQDWSYRRNKRWRVIAGWRQSSTTHCCASWINSTSVSGFPQSSCSKAEGRQRFYSRCSQSCRRLRQFI